MHGLTDIVIASKREGEITHAAADMGTGQVCTYPFCGADEISCIGIMLIHSRRYCEDIRIEDDV